jgi:hypothetical protein
VVFALGAGEDVRMATRLDFTNEEWETLAEAVEFAMGAAVLQGPGQKVKVFDLRQADNMDHIVAAGLRHSAFITELNQEVESRRGDPDPLVKTRELIAAEAEIWLREAVDILRRKAPEEVAGFREYVLDMATGAAQCTGDGVLGVTAKSVSAMESEAIEKLKDAMA